MPSLFLSVILEKIIRSRWNLLQKHCLFMSELWPQQVVLSGTCFHHVSFCFTARQSFERTCGPPISRLVISIFLSLGLPGGESVQVQTSQCRSLEKQIRLVLANIESDVLQQMVDNIEHNVQLCL